MGREKLGQPIWKGAVQWSTEGLACGWAHVIELRIGQSADPIITRG